MLPRTLTNMAAAISATPELQAPLRIISAINGSIQLLL
jgi:hypothetical protein